MGLGLFSLERLAPRRGLEEVDWGSGRPGFNLQLSLTSHGTGPCALPSLNFLICKMGMILSSSQDGGGVYGCV